MDIDNNTSELVATKNKEEISNVFHLNKHNDSYFSPSKNGKFLRVSSLNRLLDNRDKPREWETFSFVRHNFPIQYKQFKKVDN